MLCSFVNWQARGGDGIVPFTRNPVLSLCGRRNAETATAFSSEAMKEGGPRKSRPAPVSPSPVYLEPTELRILSLASPMVKLPGAWRGGYSSNV